MERIFNANNLCANRPESMMKEHFSKLLVGVTQRVDNVAAYKERRDALDQKLVQLLTYAGFLPVPVPNSLFGTENTKQSAAQPMLNCWLQAVKPRAFLLSGGNDIGECPERVATEQYLLDWARINQLPVLGICRGLQMMALLNEATLIKVEGHVKSRHYLDIYEKTSDFPASVNSYHNWGITSCPVGFRVLARSEDGAIEAISHIKLPWEGWMWHPERETPFSPKDIKRLKELFSN